jgi:hypothetical protein
VSLKKDNSQRKDVEVTVNSKEENSEDFGGFCPRIRPRTSRNTNVEEEITGSAEAGMLNFQQYKYRSFLARFRKGIAWATSLALKFSPVWTPT